MISDPVVQIPLPGILSETVRKFLMHDDQSVYYDCYEIDDHDQILRRWREELCSLVEFCGWEADKDG